MSVSLTKSEESAKSEKPEKCAYCGKRNNSVSMHSGILECNSCWYDRKLNLPAALHWAKVAEGYLSNVDSWDYGNYAPACISARMSEESKMSDLFAKFGLTPKDAFLVSLHVAAAMRDESEKLIKRRKG